jgi:repressor LexA
MSDNRPTKKQRELLNFLDTFIKGNGYGPSYREVMRALDYKSVSTVATHIDGLIARGYLRKRDNSARSLEIVDLPAHPKSSPDTSSHEAWLMLRAQELVKQYSHTPDEQLKADALALIDALRIIGCDTESNRLRLQLENYDKKH